jgi:hypothetical protein
MPTPLRQPRSSNGSERVKMIYTCPLRQIYPEDCVLFWRVKLELSGLLLFQDSFKTCREEII